MTKWERHSQFTKMKKNCKQQSLLYFFKTYENYLYLLAVDCGYNKKKLCAFVLKANDCFAKERYIDFFGQGCIVFCCANPFIEN